MAKAAVIYWSGTGNTAAMAEAVAKGLESAGFAVEVCSCDAFDAGQLSEYDRLAFGCPAMGDEVLEESEFEPFFEGVEGALSGRKVALFGSYGWGDGQWMRDWVQRCKDDGADVFEEGLIANGEADAAECESFGARFAAY